MGNILSKLQNSSTVTSSQQLKGGFYFELECSGLLLFNSIPRTQDTIQLIILLGTHLKVLGFLDQNANQILYLEKQQQSPTVFEITLRDKHIHRH